MKAVCLIFIAVFATSLAEVLEDKCPPNYFYIASKCYRFHQNPIMWQAAQRTCEGESAKMASVQTQAEYSGLLAHINQNYAGTYWVSGAPVNGVWMWTSEGTPLKAEWFGRTPSTASSKCAYFCSNTNKYWDGNCVDHKRFICEKAAISPLVPGAEIDTQPGQFQVQEPTKLIDVRRSD